MLSRREEPSHSSIAFTAGILELMDDRELEGVIGMNWGMCCIAIF